MGDPVVVGLVLIPIGHWYYAFLKLHDWKKKTKNVAFGHVDPA